MRDALGQGASSCISPGCVDLSSAKLAACGVRVGGGCLKLSVEMFFNSSQL